MTKVCGMSNASGIPYKKFSTPDSAINAVPCTVEYNANRFSTESVFSHARGHVCMVMLHLNNPQLRLLQCTTRRAKCRMEITGHNLWLNIKKLLQMINARKV
ncbi:hypothetical protein TUM12147_43770 [Citrobacter europaeus]|nr:hypothetical protein TUM12147_43770 [Citrobacter europaeus]GIZ22103.1 hypothetical protein TUM12148_07670 [Citrobacter europaeus]